MLAHRRALVPVLGFFLLGSTWSWAVDCNGNGVRDAFDIGSGTSADCDGNGVPDECELWTQGATLLAPDPSESQHFGSPVAIDGDTLVVGAQLDDERGTQAGAAYVFKLSGTTWIQRAKLTASDSQVDGRLGRSVAISDGTIVLGSTGVDSHGAVYVYDRPSLGWSDMTETAKLTALDTEANGRIGRSVAISGNTIAIGRSQDNTSNGDHSGSAYVFERIEGGWMQQAKLIPASLSEFDLFGEAVAIDGDYIVVGARNANSPGWDAGAAFVFERIGPEWIEQPTLTPSGDTTRDAAFGWSVAIDESTVVVGAPFKSGTAGVVYVFDRIGGTWLEQSKLTASDGQVEDFFGLSVAISGDSLVVGAPGVDGQNDGAGAIYVFARDGVDWIEKIKRMAPNVDDDYKLGAAVAIGGDSIVASAPRDDQAALNAGSAFTFFSGDCDRNGVPDICEPDCNSNGVADGCDIAAGTSSDCDDGGVPDECEPDCNDDGLPDRCDIAQGFNEDCNHNSIPDECDIAVGTSRDCSENGIPDECEPDCDDNGVPNDCEIADGTSVDLDGDGMPDECQCPPSPPLLEPLPTPKNRYITLGETNGGQRIARRVTFVDLPRPFDLWNGSEMWVGPVRSVSENGASVAPVPGTATFNAATLQCSPHYADWNSLGTVHVFHEGIVPNGTYRVDAIDQSCDAGDPASFSATAEHSTARWGDTLLDLSSSPPPPPDGNVAISDALGVLGAFQSKPGAIAKARADLEPSCPDLKINVSDVLSSLSAFSGVPYPFAPSAADPCDSTCPSALP